MDIDEYFEEMQTIAIDAYEREDYDMLDRLEITLMSVCARHGIEITIEDYDTG